MRRLAFFFLILDVDYGHMASRRIPLSQSSKFSAKSRPKRQFERRSITTAYGVTFGVALRGRGLASAHAFEHKLTSPILAHHGSSQTVA